MLALFSPVPKIQRLKALKIDVFDYPTVVWHPDSKEPSRISASTLYCQNLESLAYILADDSVGLLWWAPKNACVLKQNAQWPFKFVDFCTNRKQVCNFLLVNNSNFGHVLSRFRDIAGCWKQRPLFHPNFGCSTWIRLLTLGLRGAKTLS